MYTATFASHHTNQRQAWQENTVKRLRLLLLRKRPGLFFAKELLLQPSRSDALVAHMGSRPAAHNLEHHRCTNEMISQNLKHHMRKRSIRNIHLTTCCGSSNAVPTRAQTTMEPTRLCRLIKSRTLPIPLAHLTSEVSRQRRDLSTVKLLPDQRQSRCQPRDVVEDTTAHTQAGKTFDYVPQGRKACCLSVGIKLLARRAQKSAAVIDMAHVPRLPCCVLL